VVYSTERLAAAATARWPGPASASGLSAGLGAPIIMPGMRMPIGPAGGTMDGPPVSLCAGVGASGSSSACTPVQGDASQTGYLLNSFERGTATLVLSTRLGRHRFNSTHGGVAYRAVLVAHRGIDAGDGRVGQHLHPRSGGDALHVHPASLQHLTILHVVQLQRAVLLAHRQTLA
jgi:hypothetical protein